MITLKGEYDGIGVTVFRGIKIKNLKYGDFFFHWLNT